MLKAYAHQFCRIERILTHLLVATPRDVSAYDMSSSNGPSWKSVVVSDLETISTILPELPLPPGTAKQLARAQQCAVHRENWPYLAAAISDLRNRIRDDMEDLKFVYVPSARAETYEQSQPFGAQVDEAFPSAALELIDAVHCLAFDQGTAAVFHAMRALEPALVALGKPFDVDVRANWNSALNDIERAIRSRDNKQSWPNWKEEEPFYAAAATHFFLIKNAWRNHTMHLNLRFSPQEAAGIFDNVGAFMKHLATRLSEDVEGASPAAISTGQSS
jgi:hypothetical protein